LATNTTLSGTARSSAVCRAGRRVRR
jgi:hypothetical protein